MSSVDSGAYTNVESKCIDGQSSQWWNYCQSQYEDDPWVSVELSTSATITNVNVYHGSDRENFQVWVGDGNGQT